MAIIHNLECVYISLPDSQVKLLMSLSHKFHVIMSKRLPIMVHIYCTTQKPNKYTIHENLRDTVLKSSHTHQNIFLTHGS